MNQPTEIPSFGSCWRHGLLLLVVLGSLVFVMSRQPWSQPLEYHDFADHRTFLGVPNFCDVTSNLPFLLVGIGGLSFCLRGRFAGGSVAWMTFFSGVALVTVGSAYYHWQPRNDTLVWDRLPMTIGFMAMFVALLSERLNEKLARFLLVPAVLAGLSSVIYWHLFDDLRFYMWVQLLPLVTIPAVIALFRTRYSHQWLLLAALGCYLLAKVTEVYDRETLLLSRGIVSGHTIKHLLAALCCLVILEMLRRRRLLYK